MSNNETRQGTSMTRRAALRGGFVYTFAGLIPHNVLLNALAGSRVSVAASHASNRAQHRGNLYVFPDARGKAVAIALTWPLISLGSHLGSQPVCQVRSRFGNQSWDILFFQKARQRQPRGTKKDVASSQVASPRMRISIDRFSKLS